MSDAPDQARRAERGSKLLVIALVGIFVFGMAGFAVAVYDTRNEPAPTAAPPPSLPALPALGVDEAPEPADEAGGRRFLLAVAEIEPSPVPSAEPSAASSPAPSLAPAAEVVPPDVLQASTMPVVPVTRFWSKRDGLKRRVIVEALETGSIDGFKRVVVERRIAEPLAEALGIEIHPDIRRLDMERLGKAVRKGALGLVAATSVGPSLRSLKVGGSELVGVERVDDLADWPLKVSLEVPPDETWAHERTWVLVAGGDSFTDRGVYDTVVKQGKGVDYPFAGGTARVTGHGCCDPVFNDNIVPRYVLTGNKGAVRRLFKGAELAIANHEQPVTEAAQFHTSGTRFSGCLLYTSDAADDSVYV